MSIFKLTAKQYRIGQEMGYDHTHFMHVYENGVYLFTAVNQTDYRKIRLEEKREQNATEVFANWP